jgi:hypothetical protein
MFNVKHRNQKEGQKFTLKLKPRRRRVSPGKFPGTILIEQETNAVDRLQYGMQSNLYNFNNNRFNHFFLLSSRNNLLNSYYDNMKPFLLVMRAMGVLPISATAEGKFRYGVTITTSVRIY